jgi:hypothetical protein
MLNLPQHLWARYLPGAVAAACAVFLIRYAPSNRKVAFTVWASLLGLVCMEAEYWVAHGFPRSEVPFFFGAVGVTLVAVALRELGGLLLGVVGLGFFSYVNLRYGAPYLLDYVMPALYALLICYSRNALNWVGPGIFRSGIPETVWFLLLQFAVIWRTTSLSKWNWLAGAPW